MPKVPKSSPLKLWGKAKGSKLRSSIYCSLAFPQDGTVKVWEWITGRLLGSELVGRAQEDGENEAVTKVCCSASLDPPLVVAAIEKSVLSSR